jgi:hypothetical protein
VRFKNVGSGAYSYGGKGNKDTHPFRLSLILLPSLLTFISLLRAWPLQLRQTGDKHEQNYQEDWAENRRALRGVGARARRDSASGILRISNALHQEVNRLQYDTCDVAACSESWLWVFGNVWGVDYGDWQADYPDPDHLEDSELKEREKLVVEAVIFAGR